MENSPVSFNVTLSSDTNITYDLTIVNDAGASSDIHSKLNEYHVFLCFMVLLLASTPRSLTRRSQILVLKNAASRKFLPTLRPSVINLVQNETKLWIFIGRFFTETLVANINAYLYFLLIA